MLRREFGIHPFNTYDISIAKIQLYFRIITSQINYVDKYDNKVDRRVAGDLPSVASDSFLLQDQDSKT